MFKKSQNVKLRLPKISQKLSYHICILIVDNNISSFRMFEQEYFDDLSLQVAILFNQDEIMPNCDTDKHGQISQLSSRSDFSGPLDILIESEKIGPSRYLKNLTRLVGVAVSCTRKYRCMWRCCNLAIFAGMILQDLINEVDVCWPQIEA